MERTQSTHGADYFAGRFIIWKYLDSGDVYFTMVVGCLRGDHSRCIYGGKNFGEVGILLVMPDFATNMWGIGQSGCLFAGQDLHDWGCSVAFVYLPIIEKYHSH